MFKKILILALALALPYFLRADDFVDFSSGSLLLNRGGSIEIYLDPQDERGISIAAKNLCTDLEAVCGASTRIVSNPDARVLIGTLGHSKAIDNLAKAGRINGSELNGKREKYLIIADGSQLIIAGSDHRGTIYGIYELSRQIGVSPWYYWADVPIEEHSAIYIKSGTYTDGEPSVRYRGIFLNDEAPCLTSWVKNSFGTDYGGHEFYAKVFELLLRLKANFIWPAMWSWAFYADDPLNSATADEMGIIVGTSHHEPMCRSQKEWKGGKWDYSSNKKALDSFWRGGVARNKNTEDLITVGMRGDGDEPMSETQNIKLLQKIIKNQRKLIKRERGKKASEVPQVWALYKEVQDYYDAGMKVPDDITLLLSDDNWGDIRRVPNPKERQRKGGWGLYYHVDYVGAPRNSKWLNVTPIQNMWEQLYLATQYGIDRIWILNVGDLKPMEYPIDLFLAMAWDTGKYGVDNLLDHTRSFCAGAFGEDNAEEAADILNLCCKYNGRMTAEMMTCNSYSIPQWQQYCSEYQQLESRALRQYAELKPEYRDAYFELILFPIQAMSNIHDMYYSQAMNHLLYADGKPEASLWAERCKQAFQRDSLLCASYNHSFAGGKWNGMMTQKHIGYTSWNDDFEKDTLPELNITTESSPIINNYDIAIEVVNYHSATNAPKARWTHIPYMGRGEGAMALMPYTEPTEGASLSYQFSAGKDTQEAEIKIVTKCTLDFLNQGGLRYSVSIDGGTPQTINFNSDLNEKPENIYSIYYPTVASRVVEKTLNKRLNPDTEVHEIKIQPLDPGIVFEQIFVKFSKKH